MAGLWSWMTGALLGLMAGALFMPRPAWSLTWALAGLALAAGLGRLGQGGPVLVALLLGWVPGWLWSGGDAWLRHQRQLDPELVGQDLVLQGRVTGLVENRPAHGRPGARLLFRVQHCRPLEEGGEHRCSALRRVRLSWYQPPPVQAGQQWQLVVRLRPPRGLSNPGGFDQGRHLYRNGIDAIGYVRDRPPAQMLGERPGFDAWRARLADELAERLEPRPGQGWLRALAAADQRGLSDEDWALLRATGTVHLFVVSGLHIGLAGGLLLAGLRAGMRALPDRGGAPGAVVLVAVLLAAAYAGLAGWGIPARRAWLMFAALATLWWSRRAQQPLFSLLWVAVVVLALQPVSAWAPGFWLSFGAVALLLLARSGRVPAGRRLGVLLHIQWAIFLGLMLPLTALGAPVSPLGLPANLVAVPLVGGVVVPVNLLAVALMTPAPALADGLWWLADGVLSGVLAWLKWLASWQASLGWQAPQIAPLHAALALGGSLLWLLPRGWPGRLGAPLLLAPALLTRPELPDPGEWRAAVLDVGQGLAVVVETAGHRLVYDAGPSGEHYDSGRGVVLPWLARRGHRSVDLLMVSHNHNDHAGGAPAVLDAMAPPRVLTGEPVTGLAPASRCRAGQRWRWDGVAFEVLHPVDTVFDPRGSNDHSCVLLVDNGRHRLLLTGDIGRREELEILRRLADQPGGRKRLRGAVLVAPHHGSRTSSGPAWVNAVAPPHVLVSAGWKHHFGHPHPEVVERYQRAAARVWSTAEHGALLLETRGQQLRLQSTRR